MSDWTLPLRHAIVSGMSESGKTTFCVHYLLNVMAACRFVFDDTGQVAARLKLRHASTARELELALKTRWVVFNPHVMFPGETQKAFLFFCEWVMDCARRCPGLKVVLVDEVWQWCSPNAMPKEFATIAQAGRADGVQLLVATQMPHKLHSSLVGQCAEVITFRLDERIALQRLAESDFGFNPDEVQRLPIGHWIARNRKSRSELRGKMW